MIDVKTKIATQTGAVRRDIYRLGELKTEITFLRQINTTHGKTSSRNYLRNEDPEIYEAEIRKDEVKRMVLKLEAEIDEIQDRLDEFNATNKIDIEIPEAFTSPL